MVQSLFTGDGGGRSWFGAGAGGVVPVGKVRTSVLNLLTLRCQLNTQGKVLRRSLDMKICS